MSSSCNIFLPIGTTNEKITEVLARLMGAEMIQDSFEKQSFSRSSRDMVKVKEKFDPALPSSKTNSWFVQVEGAEMQSSDKFNPSYNHFQLVFKDMAETRYMWNFSTETESEKYKLINPGSYAMSGAVAKRMIDFFGGYAIYDDQKDTGEPDPTKNPYVYENKNPVFGARQSGQSSDSRWYQYQNAIWNIKPLTSEEILAMKEILPLREQCAKLVECLKKYELFQQMDKLLADKPESSSRIKI